MNLLIIFVIFFAIYSAIVRATYLKFLKNGIGLTLKYKVMLIFLPIVILFVHGKLAVKMFPENKKKSLQVFIIAIAKYPIILGNLIEVILESMAECNVYGYSRYLKVVPKKQQAAQNSKAFDNVSIKVKELLSFLRKDSNYEKELLTGIAY